MRSFFSLMNRFRKDRRGNIAVIFALALLPLISFMGAAIDYSRASRARTSMQAALDSTVLMVSKDLSQHLITTADVNTKAQAYFTALYHDSEAQSVTIAATYTVGSGSTGSTVQVNGSGLVMTDFLRVLDVIPGSGSHDQLNFSSSSTATWGNVKMRVALVLDNTGSMAQSGKITALRTAVAGSGGLIDQLSALAQNPGDVYISVVPFAKDVNVGAGLYPQNWIDWTDWLNPPTQQPNNGSYQATLPFNWHAVGPGAKCPFTNVLGHTDGRANGGFVCMTQPANGSSTASTVPSSGTYSGYICPSADANSHAAYNGCWDSEPAGTGTFCSGSSSCSCPTTSSGSNVPGCNCFNSGSSKYCTGNLYVHNWTQPGPTDTTHNLNQPRVGAGPVISVENCATASPVGNCAAVGFAGNQWTPTNSTPTVQNRYIGASTNPISTWTGCIADRTQSNDATGVLPVTSDVTTLFPANQYYENNTAYCSSSSSTPLEPIIPLSYDWSSLKTAVNAMQPTGGTDQAVGLAWGWQTLLPNSPLPAPSEDSATTYNRVIILLSDGLNTEDRWPGYGNGNTQNNGSGNSQFPGLIDYRQKLLCDNLKNAKDSIGNTMYTVYMIQVDTDGAPTSTILQYCASSPDKFYKLTSSTQIVTTFNTIGTALSKLRVAR